MKESLKFLEHLSYSSLSQFDNCPRCWHLKYRLGFKTPPSSELELGSAVHTAVEHYHKGWKYNPELKVPHKKWDYRLEDFMKPYKEIYLPEHANVVESRFEIEIPHPLDSKVLELPFQVVIDRIWGDNIHDLKTSASKYQDKEIDRTHQHSIYAFAYRQKYGKKELNFIYDVLVKNKVPKLQIVELEISDENINNALGWIWGVWERMQVLDMPKRHTWFCWNKGLLP